MKFGLPGTLIAAALVLVALFGTQVPSVVIAHSPKSGKVVDAETGQGMADVYLVASASFYAQGLFGGSVDEPLYRIVTRTDSKGDFKLPSTWSKAGFALPIASPRVVWMVTAVKPGYVIVGDEDALNSWYKDGSPRLLPRSVGANPTLNGKERWSKYHRYSYEILRWLTSRRWSISGSKRRLDRERRPSKRQRI